MNGIPWLHDEGDGDWRIAKIDRYEAEGGPYPRNDTMKCAECHTPVVLLRMSGLCPIGDADRCPLAATKPEAQVDENCGYVVGSLACEAAHDRDSS